VRIPLSCFAALAAFALAACDGGSVGDPVGRSVSPEAIRAAATDGQVERFYELRGWQPAWSEERIAQLEAALAGAERHALDAGNFRVDRNRDSDPAQTEVALTAAALRYADALADGLADPKSLWDLYTLPKNRVDLAAGLNQAIEANQVEPWLAGLAPADPEYRALSDSYVAYRRRAAQTLRVTVPAGGAIEPGDRDPRLPAIVAALRGHGYLAAPAAAAEDPAKQETRPADQQRYTEEIEVAIRRLQQDYGIEPDGVISTATLEALNTGARDRARILAVNLERRRWLPRNPSATRIDVNTAATFLEYWRDGAPVHRARVVVGQPDWETPQLNSQLRRLVANPPWNVPESIAEEEILPKGAGYMRENNMSFRDGRIVQAPGPDSALGLVKLDLDNPHAIYLHDTPAKALFAEEERHASHGCVRVQDAVAFARMIAADQNKLADFDRALAAGDESAVTLPRAIPVRLLYHSAYVENGRVVFRPDPYGWDDRLAQALGLAVEVRRRVQRRVPTDVGP
jgi:murein L,D-transpeptidase YcbB/YkuD